MMIWLYVAEITINNCGPWERNIVASIEIIIVAQHVAADYRKIGLLNWARRAHIVHSQYTSKTLLRLAILPNDIFQINLSKISRVDRASNNLPFSPLFCDI